MGIEKTCVMARLDYGSRCIKAIILLNGVFPWLCPPPPPNFSLVVLHMIPIVFLHLWCVLGGSDWNWMKRNMLCSIDSQTCFCTSWHGMPTWISRSRISYSIAHCVNLLTTYLQACTNTLIKYGGCWMQNNQILTKSQLKTNAIFRRWKCSVLEPKN
jgi:hypothetical protein